jgi:hypothetical protein
MSLSPCVKTQLLHGIKWRHQLRLPIIDMTVRRILPRKRVGSQSALWTAGPWLIISPHQHPICNLAGSVGAQVAQLVEHAIENRSVTGSIPVLGTISSIKSNNYYRADEAET